MSGPPSQTIGSSPDDSIEQSIEALQAHAADFDAVDTAVADLFGKHKFTVSEWGKLGQHQGLLDEANGRLEKAENELRTTLAAYDAVADDFRSCTSQGRIFSKVDDAPPDEIVNEALYIIQKKWGNLDVARQLSPKIATVLPHVGHNTTG